VGTGGKERGIAQVTAAREPPNSSGGLDWGWACFIDLELMMNRFERRRVLICRRSRSFVGHAVEQKLLPDQGHAASPECAGRARAAADAFSPIRRGAVDRRASRMESTKEVLEELAR